MCRVHAVEAPMPLETGERGPDEKHGAYPSPSPDEWHDARTVRGRRDVPVWEIRRGR